MREKTKYQRIVFAYQEAGLPFTQTAIADSIGIFQTAVSKWKAGGDIKPRHIKAIAKVTKCCQEWLLSGDLPMFPMDPEVAALADALTRMDPEVRERTIRVAFAVSVEQTSKN